MEHFPIIQALCRVAMADPKPAMQKQIKRLRDALKSDGETKQVESLDIILSTPDRKKEITPSRITRSQLNHPGETLTPNSNVPVDRETAAPLAEIVFPSEIEDFMPLFTDTVNQAIISIIEEWNFSDKLSKIGITPAKTCVIYGSPGTGKTRLAFWMAAQLNLPVVLVKLDGLVSSFLGTTAKNIGNLFNFVNRYQCILLLDEFDAIAKVRNDSNEVGEIKRIVNTLLQNLDKRKDIGVTIGITNHENLLDPAVWRRFEIQLAIPKPDFETRLSIAKLFFNPMKVPESYVKLIAWLTEEATGAEIEALVRTYKKNSVIQRENQSNFLETLRQFATLNSARVREQHRNLIFGSPTKLFKAIHDNSQLSLSLAEIGEIAGKNKSTISRKLGKQRVKKSELEKSND